MDDLYRRADSELQTDEPDARPRRRRFKPVQEEAPVAVAIDPAAEAAATGVGPAVGAPAVAQPIEADEAPGRAPAASEATPAVAVSTAAPAAASSATADGRASAPQTSGDGAAAAEGDDDSAGGQRSNEELAAAFRHLHERRLHGFALLLTLGDRRTAAELTRNALRDAGPKLSELTHPERGAAWLRRHVLKHAPSRVARGGWRPFGARRPAQHSSEGIRELHADVVLIEALAVLSVRERAALILQDVERLREIDVAEALGVDRKAVETVARDARTKYSTAYADAAVRHGVADRLELPEHVRRAAQPGLPRRDSSA